MSLVITPMLSSVPSSRQIMAIRELLPVPTGPATPNRNERPARTGPELVEGSGTEQPPSAGLVELGPVLELRGRVRRDVVRVGEPGHPGHHVLDRSRGGHR